MALLCRSNTEFDEVFSNMSCFSISIEEMKDSSLHNWVSFLSELVALRHISIELMLAVKDNFRMKFTTKCNRGHQCLIQALLVQNRQHSWESDISTAHVLICFYTFCFCWTLREQLLFGVNVGESLKWYFKFIILQDFFNFWKVRFRGWETSYHLGPQYSRIDKEV